MKSSASALTKKYPEFIYKDCLYLQKNNDFKIWYDFLIPPDFKFKTEIIIKNIDQKRLKGLENDSLKNLIFHLGLIEMLNYWKLTCSPKIKIEAGGLSGEGISFARKVLERGMGQYFYENKIDFTKKEFLKIESCKRKPLEASFLKLNSKKYLIPIGGGKDSPVAIEFLRGNQRILGGFSLNAQKPQIDIFRAAKLKELISVKRNLDSQIFGMHRRSFLNGHVPFSAFLSFLSLLLAYLFDYKNIVFAWEKSSNEPNLKYKDKWINHQWSKSQEFEELFKKYCKKHLLRDAEFFSSLRNFSEIEIAEIFAKLEKYHPYFISCNSAYRIRGKKMGWCGQCPKCLFVYISLSPFLDEKKLIKIFGRNLLEDKKLLDEMLRLIGRIDFKPFECVGTPKETVFALKSTAKRYQKNKKNLPYLLKIFQEINKI